MKAGKMLNQAAKVNLNVDMRHGRVFAVQRSKDLLDSSNTFAHDKSNARFCPHFYQFYSLILS